MVFVDVLMVSRNYAPRDICSAIYDCDFPRIVVFECLKRRENIGKNGGKISFFFSFQLVRLVARNEFSKLITRF